MIAIFIFCLFINPIECGCPPDYTEADNLCFKLNSAPHSNWDSASELCAKDHTRLARIYPQEMEMLSKILPRGAQAWIGLRFDKSLHKWIWTRDKSTANLTLDYLKMLDPNATQYDDCALIKMKRGILSIDTDTCEDKWINYGLCSTEREHCSYTSELGFSQCARDENFTCSRKAVYEIDGHTLPRHANSCQIDQTNCKVRMDGSIDQSIGCFIECGENMEVNETLIMSDDCKSIVADLRCDCAQAERIKRENGKLQSRKMGVYIGIGMLVGMIALLITVALYHYIRKRHYHTERIHPPVPNVVRYSVDPVKYQGGTATY